MSLLEKIAEDLIKAQKAKDELVVSVLRMMNAAIKNAEIALRPKKLEEADISEIISKEMKKLKDSWQDFKAAARVDLVEKVEKEIKIMEQYLPKQMSADEIKSVVEKTIKEMQATLKDLGKVMGRLSKELKGKADGGIIAQLVKELLK